MDIYFCLVNVLYSLPMLSNTNSKSISQFILFVYYRFQSLHSIYLLQILIFTLYLTFQTFSLYTSLIFPFFLHYIFFDFSSFSALHYLCLFQLFSTTLSLSLPAFQWMRHSSLLLVFAKPNLQIKKSQGIFQAFQVQSNMSFRTCRQLLLLKLSCCM